MTEPSSQKSARVTWADLASRGQQIADSIAKKYPPSEIAQALETFKATVEDELEKMPSRTREATTKVLGTVTSLVETFAGASDLEGSRPNVASSIYSHGNVHTILDDNYRKSAGRTSTVISNIPAQRRFLASLDLPTATNRN